MFRRNHYVYREEASGDAAPGGAPVVPVVPVVPVEPAAPAGSVLAGGNDPANPSTPDFIPEKLRVNKEDGTFDLDASSRKVAEAYTALEKRFGAGDVPPKEASEYKITVPDALKEAFDPATDTGMQGFLTGALEKGMTQGQVDFVMGKYFEMAPQLVAGAKQYDEATCTTELAQLWTTDADMKRNVRNAYVGATAAATAAGMDIGEIMSGPLSNNPQFLRLMAAIGPEFSEDAQVGGAAMTSQEDIGTLMNSEAYTNPRHADHAKVSKQVKSYYERKYGTEPA